MATVNFPIPPNFNPQQIDLPEERHFQVSDHVFVAGEKFEGSGYVIGTLEVTPEGLSVEPPEVIMSIRPEQPFPQIWISLYEGRDGEKRVMMNGDDLQQGKVELINRGDGRLPTTPEQRRQLARRRELEWDERLRVTSAVALNGEAIAMMVEDQEGGSTIKVQVGQTFVILTLNKALPEEVAAALTFFTARSTDPQEHEPVGGGPHLYGVPFNLPTPEQLEQLAAEEPPEETKHEPGD